MLVTGGRRRRSGRVHCAFQSDKCQHRLLLCQFARCSPLGAAGKTSCTCKKARERERAPERRDTRKEHDAQSGAAYSLMRKHLTSDNTQLVKEKRKNILQLERSQSFLEITLTSWKKKKGKGFLRVLSMTYLCVSTNGNDELISSRSALISMCVRRRTNLSDISVGEREGGWERK
jgi:hypothetical protein